MNEHLDPIFKIVLPALERAGFGYWVFGGVAIAGINGGFVRTNPDADVFVLDNDYDQTIRVVSNLEKLLGWDSRDAHLQRGRPKRDWFIEGTKEDVFSIVPCYPSGDRVRLVFGSDLVPISPLTSERRTIVNHSFITPGKDFMKELLWAKVNSGSLSKQRVKKLKVDGKVVLSDSEYEMLLRSLNPDVLAF